MIDLIIIGAGPAGLTVALYAERYGLNTLILSEDIGGTANTAPLIENWPSISSITGLELMKKFKEHIQPKINLEKVISITKNKNFIIQTNKAQYESKTIIIATGTQRKKILAKNSEKFEGKGISYCTTCDAPLFKNKTVAILGGANSALESAVLLQKYAKKVYIIYRKSELRADKELINKLKNTEVIYNRNVIEFKGDKFLSSIILDNKREIKLDGVFIEFGGMPLIELIKDLNSDENGFIVVNSKKETNISGLFAAGDVTNTPLKQIVTACADGAIAALSAYNYCKNEV